MNFCFSTKASKTERSERPSTSRGGTHVVESPLVLVSDVLGTGTDQPTA